MKIWDRLKESEVARRMFEVVSLAVLVVFLIGAFLKVVDKFDEDD